MINKRNKQAVGQRILTAFRDAGAVEITPDILLPAETLLDLYGEDIRARAYVTNDPIRGEVMLRPDFTVPVVQAHMAGGAEPARYCYLGEIFRKQDSGETRPENPRDNEYLQCGYELFSRDDDADSEVFALFHRLLSRFELHAETGDMGLIFDAVRGLPLPAPRRDALLHHIWRPMRFKRLLARFSNPMEARDFPAAGKNWAGMRSKAEMIARIERLKADMHTPPLPAIWVERLERLLAVQAPAPEAITALREISADWPGITTATDRIAERFDRIAALGIDLAAITFNASHGRDTMEYYDGFTFSFSAGRKDWPFLASGGRYDAMTAVLGKGRTIPAIGGIIRPGLLAELEGMA